MGFNFIFYADEDFTKNDVIYYNVSSDNFKKLLETSTNSLLRLLIDASKGVFKKIANDNGDTEDFRGIFTSENNIISGISYEFQSLKYKALSSLLLERNIKFRRLTKSILREIDFEYISKIAEERNNVNTISVGFIDSSELSDDYIDRYLMYSRDDELACISSNLDFVILCNLILFNVFLKSDSSCFKLGEEISLKDNELLLTEFMAYFDDIMNKINLNNVIYQSLKNNN